MTPESVSCPAPDTAETFDLAAVLESVNEDRENLIAANRTVLRERNAALDEVERLRAELRSDEHRYVWHQMVSERDDLRAALDRVTALCDQWDVRAAVAGSPS
jgi:hypothetical protein